MDYAKDLANEFTAQVQDGFKIDTEQITKIGMDYKRAVWDYIKNLPRILHGITLCELNDIRDKIIGIEPEGK